jgi:hypothetical protein
MQFTYPQAFVKDVQATGVAFSPQREHPALQKINFMNSFYFSGPFFALLDPDPDRESGSGY